MKKFLFSITFFCCSFLLNAQTTIEEDLVWMREHAAEIFLQRSYANNIIHGDGVEFTKKYIRLKSAHDEETTIPWKKIIAIYEIDYGEEAEIFIVSSDKEDRENLGITLSIANDPLRARYLKAFKNLARKKGAKFVEKDIYE